MVQVSTTIAVVGCVLSFSRSLFVSSSPTASSADAAIDELPDGYHRSPIHWRGILQAGKEEVYLSGMDFDEIEAKARALNPSYTIFARGNSSDAADRGYLNKRQTQDFHCGWPESWEYSLSTAAAWAGIDYLEDIIGNCRAAPGPGSCGRVSCSYDTGIWYCNDNTDEYWVPCGWIGDVAATVVTECTVKIEDKLYGVKGQIFDSRNWNVIVAGTLC
ncbi:hypothetical protein QBC34DRAFT_380007 [Podospora aff. communis PSN243]|uniref:SCP domain-containing protein n=1 Tax=Podospora aff. communis PSN243 TaxID=3040156 RepID=A0AAV9GNN2_9PEZI|nr:hypothetical protein QBC34DRAFT_380007 [Podospora aff. communis PSN243]